MDETEAPASDLEQERVNAWLLATLGDKLARHLEWIIDEPDSGLVPEVLAAIRQAAAEDVGQWLRAMQQTGFKRPATLPPPVTDHSFRPARLSGEDMCTYSWRVESERIYCQRPEAEHTSKDH